MKNWKKIDKNQSWWVLEATFTTAGGFFLPFPIVWRCLPWVNSLSLSTVPWTFRFFIFFWCFSSPFNKDVLSSRFRASRLLSFISHEHWIQRLHTGWQNEHRCTRFCCKKCQHISPTKIAAFKWRIVVPLSNKTWAEVPRNSTPQGNAAFV